MSSYWAGTSEGQKDTEGPVLGFKNFIDLLGWNEQLVLIFFER